MRSKNWPKRSALACGAISLLSAAWAPTPAVPPPAKTPAIALIDAADAQQWQTWAGEVGWRVITPGPTDSAIDLRVEALAKAVQDAVRGGVDPARVYLAGRGNAAGAVFYTVSRVPDLWAAAVALGGSPQAAIDSDRMFTVNFTNVPVLWIGAGTEDEALAKKLKDEDLSLEYRTAAGLTSKAVLDWLASHRREEFPMDVDCETNSPTFARCYWIEMTKFDVNERNDVLPSTHLEPSSGAALDLGGFGYMKDDPGPGILVSFLPEKYSGPLKIGDRILALDGRPIENARQYVETMSKVTDEKAVVAMVQRGKDRIRMETRIVLPRREVLVTARVQGKYTPDDKSIQIISRTVKEMRVTIPPEWAQGGRLYWNGLSLDKIDTPGCFDLTIDKELLHSAPCGK